MKKGMMMLMVTILAFSLFGNGGQESATKIEENEDVMLRISWWGNQGRHEKTNQILQMYSELNPEISFETEFSGWGGYFDKISIQAATKNLPDIIQMNYPNLTDYAGTGDDSVLADLVPFIKDAIIDTRHIADDQISAGYLGDKMFGISLGTNAFAVLYDPEIYAQTGVNPPTGDTSFEQFLTDCHTITEKTGLYSYNQEFRETLRQYTRSLGKSIFSADGHSLNFDKEDLKYLFEISIENMKSGISPSPADGIAVTSLENEWIVLGKSSSKTIWSNKFQAYEKAAGRSLELAVFPTMGPNRNMYLKPAMMFSMAEHSEYKKEAAEFISYFLNDIEVNKVLLGDRGVPVSSTVREAIKPFLNEAQQKVFSYLGEAEKYSSTIDKIDPPGSAEILDALIIYSEKAQYEVISVDEAVDGFFEEAAKIFEKNK